MYDNKNFSGRWFYAFITKIEYVAESAANIYFETDVFQTWYLDCTLLASFVEREHITTDTAGLNVIDEGLETGEYVCNTAEALAGMGVMDIIIATTIKLEDVPNLAITYDPVGAIYCGVYSGCNFYGTRDAEEASAFINAYNVMGKLDAIIAVFMCPHLVSEASETTIDLLDLPTTGSVIDVTVTSWPTSIDGYTPRNKKLLCFPYQFIDVNNNNGSQGVYRWERFTHQTDHKLFQIIGGIAPGATYKLLPKYKTPGGQGYNNFAETMTLSGFPMCCFAGSSFQTYMAQNAPGMAVSLGAAIIGAATGNPIAIGGGVAGVAAQLAGVAGKAIEPPQLSGNIGSGHANSSLGLNDFIICGKSIRAQYAKIIDDYFHMYGYKTNQVKVPNVNSRTYWNFVKTIDVNIKGAIPNDDLEKLKNIFNGGVTFWHNTSYIGDYSKDNYT
jgi:hypothetical protein